jgi:hypothetical protein
VRIGKLLPQGEWRGPLKTRAEPSGDPLAAAKRTPEPLTLSDARVSRPVEVGAGLLRTAPKALKTHYLLAYLRR